MNRGRCIGLVGCFVPGEAHVRVDSEQLTAARPRVGDIVLAQLTQVRSEIRDESQRRIPHPGLVALLVALKPFPVVVAGQFLEELEESGSKVRCCHTWSCRIAAIIACPGPCKAGFVRVPGRSPKPAW